MDFEQRMKLFIPVCMGKRRGNLNDKWRIVDIKILLILWNIFCVSIKENR